MGLELSQDYDITTTNYMSSHPPVVFRDIQEAAKVLQGVANPTPVHRSRTINRLTGADAYFKCENFQRTGAFKFRGAYNALAHLPEASHRAGILTYSSGNHAQAIALAGQLTGIPATIIMPSDAPAVKLEATRQYGADVIIYDREETTREALAERIQEEKGLPIIPPYNHPHVIAGQGTTALELFSAVPDLDILLVCCGGGGLLSGCAIAASTLASSCKVIGVEPALADDACRSFRSGTLQTVHNPPTIADGARTPSLGSLTFPLIRHHVHDMVCVSEKAIIETMRFLWERMKIIVEPTGALATAALLDGVVKAEGQKVGIIVSGGNADLSVVTKYLVS